MDCAPGPPSRAVIFAAAGWYVPTGTMEGRQLGRYKLIEEIGQGGMAVVWRGVDTTLQREVAVKILHPHLSRKEANRQRFAREARVVATLHHDNIVEIYDFSDGEKNVAGNDAYIVTEYIRGRTLADFCDATPSIPVEIGTLIVVEICEAVAHAHALGIVHRDIKPENVMIRQDGCLKLMDFGIARVNDDSGATMTGTLMGSPQYMSPEQVAGGELGPRSDLFSIGILLYRLITGTLPFEAPNPASILRSILESTPIPADQRNPLVGRTLAGATRRALAKSPEDRQESVAALREDLLAAIAPAGLGAPREELKSYFADPAAYGAALQTRLIARYADAGRACAASRDVAGAMEFWSRVLELDPSNAGVRDALDALGRGRRNSRVAAIALGSVALAVLAAGAGSRGWHAWVARATPTPTPVAVVATPPPTPAPTATPRASATMTARATATPKTPATPEPAPTPIALLVPSPAPSAFPTATPLPPGKGAFVLSLAVPAELYIEGKLIGNTRDSKTVLNTDIPLVPGRYAVSIVPDKNPAELGCKTLEGFVVIDRPGARVRKMFRTRDGAPDELLDPEHIYLRGCPIRFRIDAGDASRAVKELRLDGAPIRTDDDGGVKSTSGRHTLKIVADVFAPYEKEIELLPREDLGQGMPVEKADLKKQP